MGVIPIVVESRRHQQFRNGRAIPAGDKGRRGSNGRISANSVRRGSNGRIGPGVEFVRRGSNSRISFENTRRGSCGRSADMNRRGSAGGVKLDIRRGSVGKTETDSSSLQDNRQIRRGSGAGILKQLPRRGSRQNLKSLTINIFVEGGEEKKDKEKKNKEDKGKDKKENKKDEEKIEEDGEEKKERKYIKGRTDENKENKSQDGPWKVLDRGLVKVRGGGEVQVNPVSGGILQQRRGDLNPTPGYAGTRRTQTLSALPREKVLKKDLSTGSQELKNKSQEKNIKCENTFSKFAKDAVNSHNKYRTKHGVKPLELDLDLCAHAQQYAEELAASCTFQHSGDVKYGENLYWAWSSNPSFQLQGWEAVDSWYAECLNYNYNIEPTDTETGHFTQLVWSTSRRLGVGLARSCAGRHIVVMKYDPPGNYVGQYTKHVFKPVL